MKKISLFLKFVDKNILKILLGLFVFVVPLYPKIPFRTVNYTYISIRLEDFFVAFMVFVFFIQLLRKKAILNRKFLVPFLLYWLAVLASFFYGAYKLKTIIIPNVGFLHSLRRIEYMIMFFIASSVIKTKKDLALILKLFMSALFLVGGYALGQKFLGWPAIQTMNPEYAKGYLLTLTPEARVSSTFAGHYDLAAYLVLLMPLTLAMYFWKKKITYYFVFALSILILVLTASRASYVAFIVSITLFLLIIKKPKHIPLVIIITLVFTLSSHSLSSRLKRTFQVRQVFINEKTGQKILPQKITTKKLPAGTFYLTNIKKEASPVTAKQKVALKNKIIGTIRENAKRKGEKLTKKEEVDLATSIAAKLKAVRTVVPDISFSTRLQVEWPRAIGAFIKSPFLGTGPSSITAATDNDYLRSLGEVGLTGTLLMGIIIFSLLKSLYLSPTNKKQEKILSIALASGIFALLINALYIDVFEASKVAYNIWFLSGIFIGYLSKK